MILVTFKVPQAANSAAVNSTAVMTSNINKTAKLAVDRQPINSRTVASKSLDSISFSMISVELLDRIP
jgi:hypothetical protein